MDLEIFIETKADPDLYTKTEDFEMNLSDAKDPGLGLNPLRVPQLATTASQSSTAPASDSNRTQSKENLMDYMDYVTEYSPLVKRVIKIPNHCHFIDLTFLAGGDPGKTLVNLRWKGAKLMGLKTERQARQIEHQVTRSYIHFEADMFKHHFNDSTLTPTYFVGKQKLLEEFNDHLRSVWLKVLKTIW